MQKIKMLLNLRQKLFNLNFMWIIKVEGLIKLHLIWISIKQIIFLLQKKLINLKIAKFTAIELMFKIQYFKMATKSYEKSSLELKINFC